MIEEKLWWRWK